MSDTKVDIEMVQIPEGEFLMGSKEDDINCWEDELPQHKVKIPTFLMGKYPITQSQWRVVARYDHINKDLDSEPSHFKGDDHPVHNVSWHDAIEFCARLSVSTGIHFCLPTEAQWEYACRAGTTTPYSTGEMLTKEQANFDELVDSTSEVGSYPPNPWGIHDMHGNVWEWCLDHWHENYEGAPSDGSAWIEGESSKAVLRGGSWYLGVRYCRSACHTYNDQDNRDYDIGFRVASHEGEYSV